MDMELLQKAVDEYKRGERTLYQMGSFLFVQGFTVLPIRNDELDCYVSDSPGRIFRPVTPAEAQELLKNPYCTNRAAIKAFLQRLL